MTDTDKIAAIRAALAARFIAEDESSGHLDEWDGGTCNGLAIAIGLIEGLLADSPDIMPPAAQIAAERLSAEAAAMGEDSTEWVAEWLTGCAEHSFTVCRAVLNTTPADTQD